MNERSKEPVQETPLPPEEAAERLVRPLPTPEAAVTPAGPVKPELTQCQKDGSMFEQ